MGYSRTNPQSHTLGMVGAKGVETCSSQITRGLGCRILRRIWEEADARSVNPRNSTWEEVCTRNIPTARIQGPLLNWEIHCRLWSALIHVNQKICTTTLLKDNSVPLGHSFMDHNGNPLRQTLTLALHARRAPKTRLDLNE